METSGNPVAAPLLDFKLHSPNFTRCSNPVLFVCFTVQRNKRKDSAKELSEVLRVCQQFMCQRWPRWVNCLKIIFCNTNYFILSNVVWKPIENDFFVETGQKMGKKSREKSFQYFVLIFNNGKSRKCLKYGKGWDCFIIALGCKCLKNHPISSKCQFGHSSFRHFYPAVHFPLVEIPQMSIPLDVKILALA